MTYFDDVTVGASEVPEPSTVFERLRYNLLQQAGLIKPPPPAYTAESIAKLYESEWLPWFEKAMRDRLVMGALRYRTLADNRRLKPQRNVIQSCIKRLEAYLSNGNLEHLVDVANLCIVEANNPNHPNAHFDSLDEHDMHVQEFSHG